MKGGCDEEGCDVLDEETVFEAGSGSEPSGVMAADWRRGAPRLACAMSDEERVVAAAVLVKRP